MRIAAVILSGGSSTRMGRPKALLPLGDGCFLTRIAETARLAGIITIRIVAGDHFPEIAAALPEFASRMIRNPHPEQGQLSSLRLGISAVRTECDGLLMFLVDHPLVRPETVRRLIDSFSAGAGQIAVPTYRGRRGHPVLFAAALFDELMTVPLEGGARQVVHARPERVAEVAVDDPGILRDIDTPADYEKVNADGIR